MKALQEVLRAYVPIGPQEQADCARMQEWLSACPETILTRQNPVAHFTSSGLVVDPTRRQVLLIHHRIYNAWTWTGGHADGDPRLLQVALREAEEETGLGKMAPLTGEIATLDVLPVAGHWKNGAYVSAHLHLSVGYLLVTEDTRPPVGNPAENRGAKWVPVEQFTRWATEEAMQPVYEKLLARLKALDSP